MSVLALTLLCVGVAGAGNVLGGLVVTVRRRWDDHLLHYFVALSAGFMLAAVILKMIPESGRLTAFAPVLVLAGYLLIHLFEHTVAPHFHFGEETHPERVSHTTAMSALLGLAVHSLFDGISIGSGFLIDRTLGFLLFTAIVLHKAPEGFTIASIMLAAGRGRGAAQLSSIAVGMAGILGALRVLPLQRFAGVLLYYVTERMLSALGV